MDITPSLLYKMITTSTLVSLSLSLSFSEDSFHLMRQLYVTHMARTEGCGLPESA